MAQRRMFSPKIVDTDAFLEMPGGSQLLYFHLAMRADDDGFVSSPKKIMKIVGSQEDELKILFVKRFILPFESGVCVIKHWLIHNYIQNDRYTPTQYVREKEMLEVDEKTRKYRLKSECIQNVSNLDTQDRLGKDRLGKDSEREGTPSPPAKLQTISFFEEEPQQQEIVQWLILKGVPESLAYSEIQKFIAYWTEPSQSGNKVRWQGEKYFDLKRRLGTWFANVHKFSTDSKRPTKVARIS